MTQTNALLHHVATQIQIAILQAQFFIGLFIMMERRRFRSIENFQIGSQQLNLT